MFLGRVRGTVVATIKHPSLVAHRMLWVERVDPDGKAGKGYVLALDTVYAGAGETVLVLDEGNGARQVLNDPDAPVRAVIVGVVDEIDYREPAPAPAKGKRA